MSRFPGRRDEGRADLAAQFRLDGNILQIRIGGRQAPGSRAYLVERGVDTPLRIGQQRQGVNVVGLELGQLPVLQHLARDLVMLRQLFQHIHGGRNHLAPPILDGLGQVHFVEQHIAQLLGRIDVEAMAGALEDLLADAAPSPPSAGHPWRREPRGRCARLPLPCAAGPGPGAGRCRDKPALRPASPHPL